MKRTTHGLSYSPDYRSWVGMKQRCENPKNPRWASYGERGIKVCGRWQDFSNFHADMGPRPEGTTLDRINNDGDYEPGNCRWATKKEQYSNMSKSLTFRGEQLSRKAWARRIGVSVQTITHRLRTGWPLEDVLTAGQYAAYHMGKRAK